MQHFCLFLLLLLSPVTFLLTGEWAFDRAFALLKKQASPVGDENSTDFFLAYLLGGILLYLCLVLALASTLLPLWAASLAGFLPATVRIHRAPILLRRLSVVPSVNFAIWFTAIVALGATLLATVEGYQTPWRNNYGDVAWHMGIISSFTFGANFPPQNHIFPPQALSYPFFIDLWTAALWAFDAVPEALSWIFLYQWTFLWIALYYALDGNRWRVLPWAVLFGGGSYAFVLRVFGVIPPLPLTGVGPYAHELIDHGYPWVPFLDSIWVTQRPTILGAPILLVSVLLGHRALYNPGDDANREKRAFFAGLLLGLSPLVHTHFFVTGFFYLYLIFLGPGFRRNGRRQSVKLLSWFILGVAPAILFTPWVISKSGLIQTAGAWMQGSVYQQNGFWDALAAGARMWASNGLAWLILAALGVALGRRFIAGAVVALLFLIGNFLQLAAWNWDEIKIFLALYLITMGIWQTATSRAGRLNHWWLLLLLVPGITELGVVFSHYENYTVYTKDEVEAANRIRADTPPSAIIAAKPDHNSPVTLTGRKLFYGYEGTLSSHGIKYDERRAFEIDLDKLKTCRAADLTNFCPDYLYWSARERDYWHRQTPGDGVDATALDYLFRFR